MIGNPRDKERDSMVLIKRTSRSTADANSARLVPSLEALSKLRYSPSRYFLSTTNGFGHTSHFWSTTYKPYTGRPKEYVF